MQAAGYDGAERLDPERTTPAELLQFLRDDPGAVVHEGAELASFRSTSLPDEEPHARAQARKLRRSRRP